MSVAKKKAKKRVVKKAPSRKPTKAKKPVAENPPVKSQPTYNVELTKTELVHLRDLFGVLLPPDGALTVSTALARTEGRVIAERQLCDKLLEVCETAGLPTGVGAPDYMIGIAENPVLNVFPLTGASTMEMEDDDDDEDVEDIDSSDLMTQKFDVFADEDEDEDDDYNSEG
jgi:hypothetical protein